jgi:hypothetical protein
MSIKLVSENEEAVEPTPSWEITLEAGQGNYMQNIIVGYPSYSGPLMAFFNSDDEDGSPVFLCPYHRVVSIVPYLQTESGQFAN